MLHPADAIVCVLVVIGNRGSLAVCRHDFLHVESMICY
jgi:hypothetical protein